MMMLTNRLKRESKPNTGLNVMGDEQILTLGCSSDVHCIGRSREKEDRKELTEKRRLTLDRSSDLHAIDRLI